MKATSFEFLPTGMGRLIAVFSAYFDESGSPNGAVFCVGGWIGERDSWILFEKEWADTLREFNVSSLHMIDYAHSNGEFSGWKGDEPRRKAFYSRLLWIIRNRVRTSIGAVMNNQTYLSVMATLPNPRFRHPYAVCGMECLRLIEEWATEYQIPASSITCMCEGGPVGQGEFLEAGLPLGMDLSFADKPKHLQFQAADMVAYEASKASTDVLSRRVGMG